MVKMSGFFIDSPLLRFPLEDHAGTVDSPKEKASPLGDPSHRHCNPKRQASPLWHC